MIVSNQTLCSHATQWGAIISLFTENRSMFNGSCRCSLSDWTVIICICLGWVFFLNTASVIGEMWQQLLSKSDSFPLIWIRHIFAVVTFCVCLHECGLFFLSVWQQPALLYLWMRDHCAEAKPNRPNLQRVWLIHWVLLDTWHPSQFLDGCRILKYTWV